MIDLFEIGIESLEDQAADLDNEYALKLLSEPEFLETLYAGLAVEPCRYGLCTGRWCGSSPTTLYNCADAVTAWTGSGLCWTHVREAVFNGMKVRATKYCDYYDHSETAEELNQAMHNDMRSEWWDTMLGSSETLWPQIVPDATCGICFDGIMLDNTGLPHGFDPIEANDADGVPHPVHMRCSWTCGSCDTRYTQRPRYRQDNAITNWISQFHVQLSTDLGGHSQVWCANCLEKASDNEDLSITECSNCSFTIISTTDEDGLVWSDLHDDSVCQSCYDNGVECSECGYTMYNDGYHECTWDDDDDDSQDGIHSYSYKPYPVFHGDSTVQMGFELEVESIHGNRHDGVSVFYNMDPRESHYYLKYDGSLSYGFEVVTHPHDLESYHKLDWSWLDKLNGYGFRSWNTDSCGLHVHIGLAAFKNQNHQIRFTKFIYDNERQVKRIAGRSSNYAAFDDKGKVIPKIKYKHRDVNRYSAVNVQNENTLEVRVFRGSLRKERVLSAIEFTHAVCEYTRDMKVVPKSKPFSWLRFSAFVAANDDKYPNLFTIINETFERAREIDNQQDGDDD